ncbi:MAG: DNA mismatch repair protein MutS [Desulfurella sp.]|jgi:DNA mismatch repair ATPase MutS
MESFSILFKNPTKLNENQPEYFYDLNLDKIIEQIIAIKPKYNLKPYFFTTLNNLEDIEYRHKVLMDLENAKNFNIFDKFCFQFETVNDLLAKSRKSFYKYEKQFCFLNAVNNYCNAIFYLQKESLKLDFKSQGLKAFINYLSNYTKKPDFINLSDTATELEGKLLSIKFNILIKDATITISKDNTNDFEQDVIDTFLHLAGNVDKEYTNFKQSTDTNHIEYQIVEKLEKLYPDIFTRLDSFFDQMQDFIDKTIETFVDQIQFYFAFLNYMKRFERNNIKFSYPEFSKETIYIENAYDIDLADEFIKYNKICVANDFNMQKDEKIAIITGPNQGGKTTFGRCIGQIIHLSKLGLKVPATKAQIFLFDNIWPCFERQEQVQNLKSRLENDLIRIKKILDNTTSNSILIFNEVFSSTTYDDALFLSKQILKIILEKGCLCIWVTFMDELCKTEKTASFVASIDQSQNRTFKIVRKPPDGLAYAMSIVSKYNLTKKDIDQRIKNASLFDV